MIQLPYPGTPIIPLTACSVHLTHEGHHLKHCLTHFLNSHRRFDSEALPVSYIISIRLRLWLGELDEKIPEYVKYIFVVAMATFGWYKDCVLDILVALDVSFLYDSDSGGWDFKSQMVVALFITAFLSQTIVGLRVLLYGPDRLLGAEFQDASKVRTAVLWIIFIVLCPVAPAIVLYLRARRGRNIRKEEKRLLKWFRYFLSISVDSLLSQKNSVNGGKSWRRGKNWSSTTYH